jgi:hypothetical protein
VDFTPSWLHSFFAASPGILAFLHWPRQSSANFVSSGMTISKAWELPMVIEEMPASP